MSITVASLINDFKHVMRSEYTIDLDFRSYRFIENDNGNVPTFKYEVGAKIVKALYDWAEAFIEERPDNFKDIGGIDYRLYLECKKLTTISFKQMVTEVCEMLCYRYTASPDADPAQVSDITLYLIAKRRGMGLNMTELADIATGIPDKRIIANYENRKRVPSLSYFCDMNNIGVSYTMLLMALNIDIHAFHVANPTPSFDDDRFVELAREQKKLVLPYFERFEDFKAKFGDVDIGYWRVWQAVIAHLVMVKTVVNLNDASDIPADFINTLSWISSSTTISIDYDVLNNSPCGI